MMINDNFLLGITKCNDLRTIPLFVTLLPTVQYVFQNFGNGAVHSGKMVLND